MSHTSKRRDSCSTLQSVGLGVSHTLKCGTRVATLRSVGHFGPQYLVHTCPTLEFAVYSFRLPFADTRNQCYWFGWSFADTRNQCYWFVITLNRKAVIFPPFSGGNFVKAGSRVNSLCEGGNKITSIQKPENYLLFSVLSLLGIGFRVRHWR